MPLIQVFIATYNRPSLVLNAIHSAINQNFDSFEVIVSDNSTNDETEALVSQIEDKRLSYKKRNPSLPAIDHLNAILKDVTAEYFMIFHDDDTMCQNMLSSLISEIKENESIIAVGANAYIIVNNKLQKHYFKSKKIGNQKINNRTELAKNYLTNSIVPFSSYLYNRKVASNLLLNSKDGGKHSDVSFLMNVCDLGLVTNIATPLMYYHFHHEQDSSNFDYFARNSLIKHIINTSYFNRKDKIVLRFRVLNLYSQTLANINNKSYQFLGWRNLKTTQIMFQIYPYSYFLKLIVKLFLARLTRMSNLLF